MKPGTLYYEKDERYFGIVLEINIVEKTIVSATNIVISKHEYRVISLTEQGLKLDKFWTLDEHDKNLTREFSWRIIC